MGLSRPMLIPEIYWLFLFLVSSPIAKCMLVGGGGGWEGGEEGRLTLQPNYSLIFLRIL